MNSITTTVIDAGGRYGLHPNWKLFSGELGYFLFEPDFLEVQRLKEKYRSRTGEVFIYDRALGKECGELEINFFHNRAMSTSVARHKDFITFVGEKKGETKVVRKEKVLMTTIDEFCSGKKFDVDFLKLDTEGTEFQILGGGVGQLNNSVMGVRCEVNFDHVFKGMPIFSTIHDFMLQHDFFLLNLGYRGQGYPLNEFVSVNSQYGIIRDCDAVWLKRKAVLFSRSFKAAQETGVKVLKYAAFCLLNMASDVAVDVLLEARQNQGLDFTDLKDTRLYSFMDVQLHRLFYSLKWQPAQSLKKHRKAYYDIFGKDMKELHEFNQSLELNPD